MAFWKSMTENVRAGTGVKAQLSEYRKEWLGYAEKITSIFEGGKKDE